MQSKKFTAIIGRVDKSMKRVGVMKTLDTKVLSKGDNLHERVD